MTAGPRVLTAAAHAAFPLGGIGTGNVSIGARGELRDWEISGRPGKESTTPTAPLRSTSDRRAGRR